MKRLESVVKMTRLKLQERQRELSEIEALERDLTRRIEEIAVSIASEGKVASDSLAATASFSGFLSSALARRRNLESSLRDLAGEKRVAEGFVQEAFQDLKKFETILERRLGEEKANRLRREQAELDEVGRTLKRANNPAFGSAGFSR